MAAFPHVILFVHNLIVIKITTAATEK